MLDLSARAPLDGASRASFPLLDPSDPDPAHRALLLDWLRVQAAFALAPADAIAALRGGLAPAALWKLASGAQRVRALRIEEGCDEWVALARCGARLAPWTSPAYPERLRSLVDAPPALLVQGDAAAWERPCVAIVGARAATSYGRDVARMLASGLAACGVVIVSGLARGIDAAAHEGALAAGGQSIAVQARGPDDVYPRAHRALAARLRASGAVVTEFGPGIEPRRPFFPLRNRIISALARAVVVVEARVRSGSLVTARHAADQGVDVFAVPGRIDWPTSQGTNALLREGAAVATSPSDILDALGIEAPALAAADAREGAPARGASSPIERALRDGPATRDELATRLRRTPESLALEIAELELAGAIALERDGRFHAKARR